MMKLKKLLQNIRARFLPANAQYVWTELEEIKRKLDVIDKKLDLYGMQIYRREDESNLDARIRFFTNLPDAAGPLALYQTVNTRLLAALDRICEANGLDYWLWSGSAVAAVARGKSIPWDDDIDICMMRADFDRLCDILKSDPEYQMTVYYSFPARNTTYRFVSRDPGIVNFIDIVPCDWASAASPQADQAYKHLHGELEREFETRPELEFWRENRWIFSEGTTRHPEIDHTRYDQEEADRAITEIRKIYETFFVKARQAGLLCGKEDAKAVAYGLDNMFDKPRREALWASDIIFPTHKISYETIPVSIPAREREFCDICFPGWPYLPGDICTHTHLPNDILHDPDKLSAMESFLRK